MNVERRFLSVLALSVGVMGCSGDDPTGPVVDELQPGTYAVSYSYASLPIAPPSHGTYAYSGTLTITEVTKSELMSGSYDLTLTVNPATPCSEFCEPLTGELAGRIINGYWVDGAYTFTTWGAELRVSRIGACSGRGVAVDMEGRTVYAPFTHCTLSRL